MHLTHTILLTAFLLLLSLFALPYLFTHSNSPQPSPHDSYQIQHYTQTLDHSQPNSLKWTQKILVDGTYWSGAEKLGPILFLTGCEYDIVDIYLGNGFFNGVVIPQLGAYAIYAEHRYFGDSMPFGSDSFDLKNIPYLTVEQTMGDYAELIQYYKTQLNCTECPFIVYGGSYCGELAAWMRMKYPDLVDAAVASSAPIRYYDSVVDPEAFYAKSTEVFNQSSTPQCAAIIKEGFNRLEQYSSKIGGYAQMNSYMDFCTNMTSAGDISTLINWFYGAYVDVSLENTIIYSGPNTGSYRVDVACEYFADLSTSSADQDIFLAMRNSSMFSMEQDPLTCLILGVEGATISTGNAFDILTCVDIPESVGPDGVHDMYPDSPWSKPGKIEYCRSTYNLGPQFDWPLSNFGGRQMSDYAKYSNIFFSNGGNDPWMLGGVTQNISDSVVSYMVDGGCHVEDFYWASPYDSDSVKFVREKAIEYMQKWIAEKQQKIKEIKE